ncbi:MAG: thiamine diphosphokinase [Ignavibacteriota bacterium]
MDDSHLLLLLDGEEPVRELVISLLLSTSSVIATDGAARYAERQGIELATIIGDMDSIPKDLRDKYSATGIRIIEEPDQFSNDFEKALRYILSERVSRNVVVLGIHGKRTDHLLTNLSVMQRFTDQFDSLIAYDATHRHHILTSKKNRYEFDLPLQSRISVTPLPEAIGVTTHGLYYPIVDELMTFGKREGLGNIITDENASVEIKNGALLISVPYTIR